MKTNARVNTLCFIVFFLSGRRSLPRRSGSTEARARTHHHRGRKPHHPCHPVGCMPSTSGGRGGGAPVGGAPEAEPSARAGLWKRGGSLRGADDQPRLTASSAKSISLICQRTRASGRLRTRLPCSAAGGDRNGRRAETANRQGKHLSASGGDGRTENRAWGAPAPCASAADGG